MPATRELSKALFDHIATRPSSISSTYSHACVIHFNDIIQILAKIEQLLARFDVISNSINFEIELSSGRSIEISGIDQLQTFDTSQNETVSSINIEMNVVLRHNASSSLEQYVIELGARSTVGEVELFLAHFEGAPDLPMARAKVKFVDYIVGKNLISTIDEWFAGLE